MEHATGNTIYVSRNPVSWIILPFHEKSIVSPVTLAPPPPPSPCFFLHPSDTRSRITFESIVRIEIALDIIIFIIIILPCPLVTLLLWWFRNLRISLFNRFDILDVEVIINFYYNIIHRRKGKILSLFSTKQWNN